MHHERQSIDSRESSPGRMKVREPCLLAIACSLFQLLGIALFARGFFPYKKVLPGFATQIAPQDYESLGLEPIDLPEKMFDRLVFIVIDALRRLVPVSLPFLKVVILCSQQTRQCTLFSGSVFTHHGIMLQSNKIRTCSPFYSACIAPNRHASANKSLDNWLNSKLSRRNSEHRRI